MNEWIPQEDLKRFVESPPAPCVSIHLPTERVDPKGKNNYLRFKNLKRMAEKEFLDHGLRKTEIGELLAPLEKLLEEENQSGGDLLDFAAVHTFLNGGTVYAVNPPEMPDDGPVAALFRCR